MLKQMGAFIIFLGFSLAFGTLIKNSRPLTSQVQRFPASPAPSGSCAGLTDDLLEAINAPTWKQFIEGRSAFSFALYQTKLAQYKELLEGKTLDEGLALFHRPEKSEEVIAFIDALNSIHRQSSIIISEKLPLLTRRKLHKLAEKMISEKRVLWRDLESLVSDIYDLNLGPQIKNKDFFRSDLLKQRVVTRLFQEELAERGLSHILPKYRIFLDKPPLIKSFLESREGELIKTALFNLPVFFGAPPMYLPKLRRMRISRELADEILMNGLGPEQMKKVEDALKLGSMDISAQARYEIIRRYFSIGATVFLSAAVAWEAYETNQVIEEEREILNQLTYDIGTSLEDAQELSRRGYQVFNDDAQARHPSCRSLETCFEKQGLLAPFQNSREDKRYLSCKQIFDRNSNCSDY